MECIDGSTFTLSDALKDHELVLINLFFTGCPPCRMEFPFLQEAWEQNSDRTGDLRLSVPLRAAAGAAVSAADKKAEKSALTRRLSRVKYGVLAVFALAIPAWFALRRVPLPGFCKYICPAGTLEGAVLLLLHPNNSELRTMTGGLFLWKIAVLLLVLAACVFLFRAFCRFLCPLGAIYSLFSRIALLGVRVDETRCTDCSACVRACPMDIRSVGNSECVQCGSCIDLCPAGIVTYNRSGALSYETLLELVAEARGQT